MSKIEKAREIFQMLEEKKQNVNSCQEDVLRKVRLQQRLLEIRC